MTAKIYRLDVIGMKKYIFPSFFLVFALFCSLVFGCGATGSAADTPISKSGFYFNTVISITIYDSSKEQLLDDCFKLAEKYENYFSNTVPDSDISKINAAGGTPVAVHEETIKLLETGLSYCELSNGKFDITIGKLSDLWDFSTKALIEESYPSMVPSSDEIEAALSTVDYHCVQINGNEVSLSNPDASLDLGGIAKGYIADQMKAYLNENGVTSGFINLGGNVLVLGPKPDGSSYNIGIQKPFDENGASIASVRVTNETVVSSGVYERCFTVDGVLYHHILDTATGYPYDNGLLGVTIITKASVDGDGLSTTCFALGLTDGMALIESLPDTEAVFITEDYELHTSSGIGTKIPFQELE
jgi:thiamine biosynthesis lipoprotein